MLKGFTRDIFGYSNEAPSAPIYDSIQLSAPPGNATTMDTCLISTGATYYITFGFAITNGLEIFTDPGLTNRLFTIDPLPPGNTVWLKNNATGLEYAVDFDATGLIDTVTNC